MKDNEVKNNTFTISNWSREDIEQLHEKLEIPNWAPWLAASKESLIGRTFVFPQGQLLIKSGLSEPVASLSMNQIDWSGKPEELPCWDAVAGDPTTYEYTYKPQGNTLVMMSMNVNPEFQGQGFAKQLIQKAKELALELKTVDFVVGSFRPNEFGKFKQTNGVIAFSDYCSLTRDDGLPVDSWLRNLTRNGMKPLLVDSQAMKVTASPAEFLAYMSNYKPTKWFQSASNIWECGEVGSWYVTEKEAVYTESNLWGIIWTKNGLV